MKILKSTINKLGEKIDLKLETRASDTSLNHMKNTFRSVSMRNASMKPQMEMMRPQFEQNSSQVNY